MFCEDFTGVDDSPEYVEHLKTVKANNYSPRFPIMKICTARLEKYRSITEEWLDLHNIKYKQLMMSPYHSPEERLRKQGFSKWKAENYMETPEASLFVESEHEQAIEIYRLVERPVFCMDTMTLYGGIGIDVPY